jgi:hypothetical protein
VKAGGFVERGVGGGSHRRLLHRLLVGGLARQRRPQRDDVVRLCIDQEDVLVSRRLLLAAVMGLLRGPVSWAVAAPFGAIHRQGGGPGPGQGARLDTGRLALRGLAQITQGALQTGQ